MTTLDQEVASSLREIRQRRRSKFILALAALIFVAGGMFALTSLMYSSTPAEVSEERIGEEPFM